MKTRVEGAKIRNVRRQLHLTQIDLAERARVSQSHVSRLEKGRRGARWRTVERVAEVLGIPPEELLAAEAPAPPPPPQAGPVGTSSGG